MLPEKFTERMKRLLGDEYDAFFRAITEDDPIRAFRINRIKVHDTDSVAQELGTEVIPYVSNAYKLKDSVAVGRTAAHHSGAIYVQDPGAMSTLAALDIPKGAWVADLCAAPGGKSSKLAEAVGEEGFLLSNEYIPKRAKLLVGNLERLGVKNAIVTSLDTGEIAKLFSGVFDITVADVPCSGEGMFRKSEEALTEWSEENVALCQRRQREILTNAAKLVKDGGVLVYSTCTFSSEENEDNVTWFLETHPDFEQMDVLESLIPHTAPAIYPELASAARRFYPHVANGEGQFVALMRRKNDTVRSEILYKETSKAPTAEEMRAVKNFFKDYLTEEPSGRLIKHGDGIVLISHGCPLPPRSVFMAGVLVGEVRKGVFFPAHQFFSAYGELFKQKIELSFAENAAERYLAGEELDTDDDTRGWCAVTYRGIPLGGGKASGGKLKNHYPKGLRNRSI